jgi:hypothetical protein
MRPAHEGRAGGASNAGPPYGNRSEQERIDVLRISPAVPRLNT